MAIKIINPGKVSFMGFCSRCSCEFSYELGDLKLSVGNRVACPTCGEYFSHPLQTKRLNASNWPEVFNIGDPCTDCGWRLMIEQNGSYTGDSPCSWCPKKTGTGGMLAIQHQSILDDITLCSAEQNCMCAGDIWARSNSCEECCSGAENK